MYSHLLDTGINQNGLELRYRHVDYFYQTCKKIHIQAYNFGSTACLYSLYFHSNGCQPGGTKVCKLYRDVLPKWVLFHKKSSAMSPLFREKTLRHG